MLTSLNDFAARPARGFGDGEEFSIGSRRMKWLYTPHVPHGWDCGILFDLSTQTLLCGDLFTQPGANMPPVTESEVLTASEGMRGMMDYYAHASSTSAILVRAPGGPPSVDARLSTRERLSRRRRIAASRTKQNVRNSCASARSYRTPSASEWAFCSVISKRPTHCRSGFGRARDRRIH